ncbi:Rpn family recombination-promoting nuclease/putative transposase [Desulfococcaceae bacterium HSG9]|nr:Rpn family recombination-promoting nuclease/putative transposase [Desulfococcaceae bacterium HSG9]
MCRINPRVDFAFKKLFGSEENKDLLISLLNAILSESEHIAYVELKNPYSLADYQAGKMSILDIKARDEFGRWFNVEMQIGYDFNFDKRSIYYWAKLVTEQLGEGMMFKELKKTYSINILDFNFIPDIDEFHNLYKIINVNTGKDDKLHDIFELHYIELRKFTKPYHELATALDRWSAFLTRAHELEPASLPKELASDKEITKAVQAVDRMFDEEERKIYDVRMHTLIEVKSKIASAEEKGLARGMERGMEQGLAQGMEQGLTQGMEQEKRNIAISLLDVLDVEIIALKTGLPTEEIERLKHGRHDG